MRGVGKAFRLISEPTVRSVYTGRSFLVGSILVYNILGSV